MAFFIYENWQAGPHKAVIHHGSCGHCNNGEGKFGNYDPSHAKWHGKFDSLSDARQVQNSMSVVVRKECHCVSKNINSTL